MALTITGYGRPRSLGGNRAQEVDITLASGDTAVTMRVPSLARPIAVLMPPGVQHTAAPTFAENVITFALTVPTATAATKVSQGLTFTAVATDRTGNLINVAFTGGGTAGAEVVTVTGNNISVQVQSGVSTVTQVRTAMQASGACTALITTTGTAGTTVATASAVFLTGGITGGAAGTALVIE